MATQEIPATPTLPVASSMSHYLDPGTDYLAIFLAYYYQMNTTSQGELDKLLGLKLRNDSQEIYSRWDHQNDPHLFLRVCFFLIQESFPALQAWVAIFRLGFARDLHWYSWNGIVDVSVFQFRQGYTISMDVRLQDTTRVFDPPGWLSDNPLSVPFSGFVDTFNGAESAPSGNNRNPDPHNGVHGNTGVSPSPRDTQDATIRFNLGPQPTLLNETTLSASRPPSGFSWLAPEPGQVNRTRSALTAWLASIGAPDAFPDIIDPNAKSDGTSLSRTPTILNGSFSGTFPDTIDPNAKSNGTSLSRTPTILNGSSSGTQTSPHPTRVVSVSSAAGTLARVPTLLNTTSLIDAQSSPVQESPSVNPLAMAGRPSSDGLGRFDTASTILAQPITNPSTQNGPNQGSLSDASDTRWGLPPSPEDRRGVSRELREEEGSPKVRRLTSLMPLTKSEEYFLDSPPDCKSSPPTQHGSRTHMEVDVQV